MRIISVAHICGMCEACGGTINFTRFEEEELLYYDADDLVNRWMDHQLNDCSPDIDKAPKPD